MTPGVSIRHVLLAVLTLSLCVCASAESWARGYHCPSGQYWRPSLRICQNHPYEGRAERNGRAERARIPRRSWARAGREGGQVVTTDTRVIPGDRTYSGGHLILKYLVQTRVVEKY